MIKLYKKHKDKVIAYHEAWVSGSWVTEHWGELGSEGETRRYRTTPGLGEDGNIEKALSGARKNGFKPIDIDDHRTLIVEYSIKGAGKAQDVKKRHELEDRLNNLLGWAGLGHCDGGSIGSGTMEACCFVVDFATAEKTIALDLKGSEFGDYRRIYDEDAEFGDS